MVALTFRRPDPIGVLYGVGDGTFTEPTIYEGPDVGAVALRGVDMDGDGRKDIVIGNRCAATVIILKNLGQRQFGMQETIRAYSVEDLEVADLNGDGKPDLVGVGLGLWTLLNGAGKSLLALPRAGQISAATVAAGLYLNEVMALNRDTLILEGSSPDWVELYNHTPRAQSLDGWALEKTTTDGTSTRWRFPIEATITPWGHLVVFCDRRGVLGTNLCAPFDLSADGELLALYSPNGLELDRLRFPAMPADVSYGRLSDGAVNLSYNPVPTPGAANRRPTNLQPAIDRRQPFVGAGATSLALTARPFDDVAVAYAAVVYRLAGQKTFTELPLSDDGRHGDKAAGDGYFGAFLPALPAGETVEYYFRVVDLEGQVATSPAEPSDDAQLYRLPTPWPGSVLRLSEVLADNRLGLRDEKGQTEDWLELVNLGADPVQLDQFALTKDVFDPLLAWRFPDGASLGPGERVVVFCDEDVSHGPPHANFKLQRDGDRVFLVQRAAPGTVVDSLSFGPLPTDASFGLVEGESEPRLLVWPTPGAANDATVLNGGSAGTALLAHWRVSGLGVGQGRALTVRWLGAPEANDLIESSADLVVWYPSVTFPTDLGEGLFQWSEPALNRSQRFYRVAAR